MYHHVTARVRLNAPESEPRSAPVVADLCVVFGAIVGLGLQRPAAQRHDHFAADG